MSHVKRFLFDDTTTNIISNKASKNYVETVDTYFTNIENSRIYFYYWNKGIHESLDVTYINFIVERIKMRQYLTNILKYENSNEDMKENIDHWLGCFENFHKKYIIMPT